MAQSALVGMINAAIAENEKTNIRVNEMYLNARVEYDSSAEKKGSGVVKASEYAKSYADILERKDIDGCRVTVFGRDDLEKPNFQKKLEKYEGEDWTT
jgi:hypothetical protein